MLKEHKEANPECTEDIKFDGLCPTKIMSRFDILSEKNSVEKGGSFYLRSKIYFAKEHLMQEYPADLNTS